MTFRKKITDIKWIITYLFHECYQAYYVKDNIPGIYQAESPLGGGRPVDRITIVGIGKFTDSFRVIHSKHRTQDDQQTEGEFFEKWIAFYHPRSRELSNVSRDRVCMFVHEQNLMCYRNKEFTKILKGR